MNKNNFGDLLNDKFAGLKRQQTGLQRLQAYFDEQFGADSCEVVLEKNSLVIVVASSAVASQLWQRQTATMDAIKTITPELATPRLRIKPR